MFPFAISFELLVVVLLERHHGWFMKSDTHDLHIKFTEFNFMKLSDTSGNSVCHHKHSMHCMLPTSHRKKKVESLKGRCKVIEPVRAEDLQYLHGSSLITELFNVSSVMAPITLKCKTVNQPVV